MCDVIQVIFEQGLTELTVHLVSHAELVCIIAKNFGSFYYCSLLPASLQNSHMLQK
jgi:hypothetical protein